MLGPLLLVRVFGRVTAHIRVVWSAHTLSTTVTLASADRVAQSSGCQMWAQRLPFMSTSLTSRLL